MLLDSGTIESLLAGARLGAASVVLTSLDSGASVRLRADADVYPASMIKVPIAAALARLIAHGALNWEEQIRVHPRNVTANDAPSPFVPGYRATLRECVHAMLSVSDNVATNVLIDVAGRELLTQRCRDLGLERTVVRRKLSGSLPLIDDAVARGRNAHPASDAARLFELIGRTARPAGDPVASGLSAQIWNAKLSRGWDAGDAFAHKTGDTDEISHDGGLLTLGNGRRYVVVVYTTLPSSDDTDARFGAFARALRALLPRG